MKIARVDANQASIVSFLRKKGVTVKHTHTIGAGFPDIACGYKKRNFLFEIKDGTKPESAKKLTPAEVIFHFEWQGQVAVVETGEQAWAIIEEATK